MTDSIQQHTHRHLLTRLFAAALCCAAPAWRVRADAPRVLTFDQAETAGISGLRAFWDQPVRLGPDGPLESIDRGEFGTAPSARWIPGGERDGALVFDALHRSLLVRFPGAAEAIAQALETGTRIRTVELILPFRDTEMWPFGYAEPSGLSFQGDRWVRRPPRWHAVAWALRRPWTADPTIGPTYNAWINGHGFWRQFGALDTSEDRFPLRFGPVEVSYREATAYRDEGTAAREAPPRTPEPAPTPGAARDDLLGDLLDTLDADMARHETPDAFDQPARMDITALLTDDRFGGSLGERLRRFEACGLILSKWETYDLHYKDLHSGYEWGTATGGRGILIHPPRLVVTLDPAPPATVPLPPAIAVPELARELAARGGSGVPTARLPEASARETMIAQHGLRQPDWMPDWQWARVQELAALADEPGMCEMPADPDAWENWIDHLLGLTPRLFIGHRTPRYAAIAHRYRDSLPEPVRRHLARYWEGWLMPDRSHRELVHPQDADRQRDWLRETGDWRGNTSYYRSGYTRQMSTMNFNHTAVAGALLGGALLEAPYPLADGRHGLDRQILRLWSWFDGTTQESIDHYYLAITLFAIKDIADFAPDPFDRLAARSALTKYTEELAGLWHPYLRRFIATSGRTFPNFIWVTQDGTQHVVHTLSRRGALRDLDNPDRFGMPVLGTDHPPRDVASQTVAGPWAPTWLSHHVDDKPLPFETTATFRQWGHRANNPLWRRSFIGRHYGLASQDGGGGRFRFLAQWQRGAAPVERLQETGTLLIRPGADRTEFIVTQGGALEMEGRKSIFQHRNIALVLTGMPDKRDARDTLRSLQTTLAFFDFRAAPAFDIHVDGQPVTALPHTFTLDQRIVLRDGNAYIGLIPVPGTDLGREIEAEIRRETATTELVTGSHIGPALLIELYNLKRPLTDADRQLDAGPAPTVDFNALGGGGDALLGDLLEETRMSDAQSRAIEQMNAAWNRMPEAFGGVVVRMADVTEFPRFEDFVAHIQASELTVQPDPEATGLVRIAFRDGADGDRLATGFRPARGGMPDRTVNDAWPYLPPAIDRDSPLSIQGSSGRLRKQGAELRTEPGRMAFLQTEPVTGTYLALNPLPDPAPLALMADSLQAATDGTVSLARLTLTPAANRVEWESAPDPRDNPPAVSAQHLLVFGPETPPTFIRNGAPVDATPRRVNVDGRYAWLLPLSADTPPDPDAAIERFRQTWPAADPPPQATGPAHRTPRRPSA